VKSAGKKSTPTPTLAQGAHDGGSGARDPDNADAHFHAATRAEKPGWPREALRHLASYRKLARE